jgi:hypothetical protein
MFYRIAITFFVLVSRQYCTIVRVALIRPHPMFEKIHLLLPWLQVLLRLLLDHLVGYLSSRAWRPNNFGRGSSRCLDFSS